MAGKLSRSQNCLPFNSMPKGMLGKETASRIGHHNTPAGAQPAGWDGAFGYVFSHLFISAHCPVKTFSLWNWCSLDFGDGPSAWSPVWFMNLGGISLTAHFSNRNYQFISQLWESAYLFFWTVAGMHRSSISISIATNCSVFCKILCLPL